MLIFILTKNIVCDILSLHNICIKKYKIAQPNQTRSQLGLFKNIQQRMGGVNQ